MANASSKKSTKKVKRYYPVQRMTRLRDLTAASAGMRLIEYDRLVSTMNRRQYRQSRVPSMKIDVDVGTAHASAGIEVYALRNTWDLHGAYRMAMKQYYNAMKEELANAPGGKTRWMDFRVQVGIGADLLVPVVHDEPSTPAGAFADVRLDDGDFSYSSVYDSAGTQKTFVTGDTPTASQYSIITEWSRSNKVQESPASVSTTLPYRDIQEDTDENNYDLVKAIGDQPPYQASADTDVWHKVGVLRTGAAGEQKLTTGFFDAPLGIVVLVSSAFTDVVSTHPITVTFQAGDYKGIKAPAYATPVLTESNEYEVV